MSKNDGGSAFPESCDADGNFPSNSISKGMTLRDYFAAKAMQGILASCPNGMDADRLPYVKWAIASYDISDAMLKAREQ